MMMMLGCQTHSLMTRRVCWADGIPHCQSLPPLFMRGSSKRVVVMMEYRWFNGPSEVYRI